MVQYKEGDVVIVDMEKAAAIGYDGPQVVTVDEINNFRGGRQRLYFKETLQCCHNYHITGFATPLLKELS